MGKRAIDTVIDWLERQQGSRGGQEIRESRKKGKEGSKNAQGSHLTSAHTENLMEP